MVATWRVVPPGRRPIDRERLRRIDEADAERVQAVRDAAMVRSAVRNGLRYVYDPQIPEEARRPEPVSLPERFVLQDIRALRLLQVPR